MIDKNIIQQVLGSLMQRPQFLGEVDKYHLSISDFSNRFERYIFLSIQDLYKNGTTTITPIDVENYLDFDDTASTLFKKSNGIEYLNDILELSNIEAFPYYYNKLKKFNLLRDLKKQGIDVSNFYINDLTDPNAESVNREFESLTTKDICDIVKKKLIKVESDYAVSEEVKVQTLASGLDELIEGFGEVQGIGAPVQGSIYNQIISGALPGTLTIRSGASGTGKTRNAIMDAAYLSFPYRYNSHLGKWQRFGSEEKVLFIITEQTFEQIQRMMLAYLTDINESLFKYAKFSDTQKIVIQQAASLIKEYEDRFIVMKMPEPTIEGLKTMIREVCLSKSIDVIFFDYIFVNPGLLREFRGFNLRNDELLLLMSTALKDLAVELNVPVFTSTQVNAAADDNRNIRNEASLAGGRATINKADNGAIMARPTREELEALATITPQYGIPNLVTDIFKVRSGEWTQVRIWSVVDLGRMVREDLFITDSQLEVISDFSKREEYLVNFCEDEAKIAERIREMNDRL